jgi:hypothetical protein
MIKLENILIAFYGITTVAVFLLMVVWGGLFDSVHTLLFREVSFLISPYSLTESTSVPLYSLYNSNLLIFAIILFLRLRNMFAKIGALYLAMSSVTGLLLIHTPMDPIYLAKSYSGTLHIGVTLMTAFFILVALVLFGYSFKKNKNLMVLSTYSFFISTIILVAGFLTAVFALLSLPTYVGFIEKLPMAAFLFWIILTAIWMLHSDRRVRYSDKPGKRRKRK